MERLRAAVKYGADAVYMGGAGLDLRAYAPGFSAEELSKGIELAHDSGVKVYLTLNIIAHNRHLEDAGIKFKDIEKLGPDALIIADAGLWELAKRTVPHIPVHLSTQAAVTNWRSAKFWFDLGVKRVNLSRELSLEEVREIRDKVDIELEVFIHGAMCVAYSGRCLLSAYFTGRGANRGECTQPCRWSYELFEENRPHDPLVLSEGKEGSFILSSRDLCMIRHIPEMIQSGVNGLKIEGRMKSIHYVATVTRVYREALDRYISDPKGYEFDPSWEAELRKVSHRSYHTGFYFGRPEQVDPDDKRSYLGDCVMTGLVLGFEKETGMAIVEQRNRFFKGDMLEVFGPKKGPYSFQVNRLYDENGTEISAAPHPRQIIRIPVEQELSHLDVLRKYI
ncbi:MAG: U32 family peptidase [Bacillota bacterium]|nr:U32 family peptidase [Bacillota bacterium]